MKQQRNRRRLILVDLDERVRRVFRERESAAVNQDVGPPQSDPDFAPYLELLPWLPDDVSVGFRLVKVE